jgi:ADP-heptose:LPS heptosyltransferase
VGSLGPDRRLKFLSAAEWVQHLPREYQYVCLQNQVRDTDRAALAASPFIVAFDDHVLDFAHTAALCECLDFVISVDTSIAHLSAALGRRTWVLLPVNPDWRWLHDREDSPWYPTMKLYRQTTVDDWSGVLARVAADLRRELHHGQ